MYFRLVTLHPSYSRDVSGSTAVSTFSTMVSSQIPAARAYPVAGQLLTPTGHAGAVVQARQLGDELYVGVHSDESILENKGPTVMNLKER